MTERDLRVRPPDWPLGLSVRITLTAAPTGIDVNLSVEAPECDDGPEALALDALVEHVGVHLRCPARAAATALAAALGHPIDPDAVPIERQ